MLGHLWPTQIKNRGRGLPMAVGRQRRPIFGEPAAQASRGGDLEQPGERLTGIGVPRRRGSGEGERRWQAGPVVENASGWVMEQ
jgi:hypothetical protein